MIVYDKRARAKMKDGKGAQNNMECLLFGFIGTVDKDRGAEIKVLNFCWGVGRRD